MKSHLISRCLVQARDSILPIMDVKFSPDGQTLAIASSDGTIYLYAPTEEYEVSSHAFLLLAVA